MLRVLYDAITAAGANRVTLLGLLDLYAVPARHSQGPCSPLIPFKILYRLGFRSRVCGAHFCIF